MILVTAATGMVGGAVLRELVERNAGGVRAVYRDPKDLAKLPAGVEPVQADFSDSASLSRALRAVDSAFLACAPVPQLVELESSFLNACKTAGTAHVVLLSAMGAGDFPKSFPSWHRKVEDYARSQGIPCSILRPNGFMQNIGAVFTATIKSQDAIYDGLGDARISYIDVRDIAAATANLLTSNQARGSVYELHGPEALSDFDLAERISKVAGRPIRYIPISLEQMKQGMIGAGIPEARATPIVELYELYLSGKGAGSDRQLRELIGREPRRIDGYLSEIASSFAN